MLKPTLYALAGASATVLIATATALAGSGVGGVFNLGQVNTVNQKSTLTGATADPELLVQNTGSGSALSLIAGAGAPAFKVNSATKIGNLNTDFLDGLDSAALQKRVTGTCAAGQAIRVVNANGTVSCQAVAGAGGSWSLSGNAGTTPGSNFLGTKDNKPLELKVNGQRALRLEPNAASPNLIGGFSGNSVDPGVYGSVIAGGGRSGNPNHVADFFAVIAGGSSNTASGGWSSVTGGFSNTASGADSTVAGGSNNTVSGLGSTVAGGVSNTASGLYSTVAGGSSNTASGDRSFAAGHLAKARHAGAFVWADPAFANFESTAPNQFLVRASGGVGLGTNSPSNRLQVAESINANAAPANHVALVENTSTGSSGDGIAVKVGFAGNPTTSNNFVTFFRGGADSPVGAIQGNGSGGIQFVSGGADFAEWLPRLHPGETIRPAEIVGLVGGRITKATRGATQAMVVSSAPIAAGNYPGRERRAAYAPVAFLGQVPARVRGPVQAGDLIVPSGRDDGTGVALPAESIGPEHSGPIVGQAWQESNSHGVRRVRIAVGIPRELAAIQGLYRQNKALERDNRSLRSQLETQNERLTRLEQAFSKLSR